MGIVLVGLPRFVGGGGGGGCLACGADALLSTFLIGFAPHFAGDPAAGVNRISRGLYGGAVIVLPALWHGEELQRLPGLVASPDSAAVPRTCPGPTRSALAGCHGAGLCGSVQDVTTGRLQDGQPGCIGGSGACTGRVLHLFLSHAQPATHAADVCESASR